MATLYDRQAIIRLALMLEMRDDIWNREGQTIFHMSDTTGQVTERVLIFLKDPVPTCDEDGIELNLNELPSEVGLNGLIEARKAKTK